MTAIMNGFYVGGYGDRCLYHCLDDGQGTLSVSGDYGIPDASYLCLSPDGRHLYAVIERERYGGRYGGGVAALAVEGDGRLRLVNEAFTGGVAPCHLSTSENGERLYVAHYGDGSTAVFDIENGRIGGLAKTIDHGKFGRPSLAWPGRQEGPHAHYAQAANGILWICDLGLDLVLALDPEGNELARHRAPPGHGPRHLAFHPSLPLAYLVCEMGQAVIGLGLGFPEKPEIQASPPIPVLREPAPGCTCAAARVSPEGRHLLVSNRGGGVDSISVLGLDAEGRVTDLIGTTRTGLCPRDFRFDPSGKRLFVACQESDLLQVFDWDGDGGLGPTGASLDIRRPTCVLFPGV